MLSKIKQFIKALTASEKGEFFKKYEKEIILFLAVFLISLLCFALGYLTAIHQEKEPIRFEEAGESTSS